MEIGLSSDDTTEGTVPASITFTAVNWSVVQTVTVTGIDDSIDDGDIVYHVVTAAAVSTDLNYNDRNAADVTVTNIDNDTLSAPVITEPAALTAFQRPTITWTTVTDAVKYEVWIKNQSTNVNPFVRVIRTANTFYPTSDLGIARYNLWIRSVTAAGEFSLYTPQYNFRIDAPAVFSNVTRNQTSAFATLAWNPLAGAVKFDVWINNLSIGQSQVLRNANVTGTSFTATTPLPMGLYRAWVRGLDASALAAQWSVPVDFRILLPVAATSPVNSTLDTTPTFTWNAVPGATAYDLVIRNDNTGAIVGNHSNLTATSFTQPTPLAIGRYRWQVVAVIAPGLRSQSATTQNFAVGGHTTLVAPIGTITSTTPTFTWTAVDGAIKYRLFVTRIDVPIAGLVNLSGLPGTSHTLTTPLPIGTYRAWVRAVGISTIGLWSVPVDFRIATTADPSSLAPLDSLLTVLSTQDLLHSDLRLPTIDVSKQPTPAAASTDVPRESAKLSDEMQPIRPRLAPSVPVSFATLNEVTEDALLLQAVMEEINNSDWLVNL